jgi:hypothetical protein
MFEPIEIEIDTEPETPAQGQAKSKAIAALLANIEEIKLIEVCKKLGCCTDNYGNPPKQKHFKVAIIHNLIEVARRNNWHVIYDTGFFYIFEGAFWVGTAR